MKDGSPAWGVFAVFTLGLVLVFYAVRDIAEGYTVFLSGVIGTRGLTVVQAPCYSALITAEERPALFWGSVGLRLALGVPVLIRCGWLLFGPRRKKRSC